jgi:two-component system, OmpR family, phosphate regulon sensor histidine kinase PhoR
MIHTDTLKRIIVLSTIIIAFFIGAQLYWLSKQYNFEQKEFTTDVVKSIRGLYEDFNSTTGLNLQNSIELPDKNTFLFKFDSVVSQNVLIDSLSSELEQASVFTDCKVGLYDVKQNKYLFEIYLPTAASHYPSITGFDLPVIKRKYSYVQLYFPHRDKYILNQMSWWIISSIILVLALISFGVSLFYLYRQKFLNEAQNDFIRNVTHEFQTPLTTLTVGLDAIIKPSIASHPEKLSKYVMLMQGQTTYLKQHIENLMKVLKAEANGLSVERDEVSPNDLIRSAVTQMYATIEETNTHIDLILEEKDEMIYVESSNLYVAILNLISNAIKYSNNPIIIVETKSTDSIYCISVKDNGIGIEEKYIKNLFKKFYRVPTGDTHNVKGLGLGLYFVKKVVNNHKGNIKVHSIPGIGTEFVIELPKN